MPHTQMLENRLRYLDIDDNARAHLQSAKRILEPALDEMLDRFYSHILKEPELKALFVDQESIDRARSAQRKHWANALFSGEYNHEYLLKAEQIGHAHARIGLTPNWYLGAYCQLLVQFIERISEKTIESGEPPTPIIQAVCKAIFLDLDLVIRCYLDAKDSAMRQILRRATTFVADISALKGELSAAAAQIRVRADEVLAEAKACASQAGQMQGDLKLAERQVKSMSPAMAAAPEEPSSERDIVDYLETSSLNADTLSARTGNAVERMEKLIASIEQLHGQTQKLHQRLEEVMFRDKLFIAEDPANSGTFRRLKAMLWGKK